MRKIMIMLSVCLLLSLPLLVNAAPGVARAQFTTAVVDREPVDEIIELPASEQRVFFFTELTDLSGQTVTHRWEYNHQVMAEINFDVRGPRWRVFSSKNLVPQWTGDWTVTVVDGMGNVLTQKSFTYR